MSLRQYQGKQLLSQLRQGDYAHAGETEAICDVMQPIPKYMHQTILDIGCGLGGTVHFLQQQGWGQSSGMDIELASIKYAKQRYPTQTFYVANALQTNTLPIATFDILCLFNAFYAFSSHTVALTNFIQLAHAHTRLIIFDYASELAPTQLVNKLNRKGTLPFNPIKLSTIEKTLQQTGWQLTRIYEQTEKFHTWYMQLLARLHAKKVGIISQFGHDAYEKADRTYSAFVAALEQGYLQGATVYATRL